MVCITMDAHARDIVQKMMLFRVDNRKHFQWQSQLKHKFRVPPTGASFVARDSNLRGAGGERAEVAICDAILPYDYEYLGNGFRLVITPLTDRIYVTATQALNLKMGCAPAGPAGTGKTETTKDLANALAKVCYVVNCSPEMDFRGLGDIFKGVASSGAWICFDEFNRLIPEVLSVCTVQFKSVCDGCKSEASTVMIEGDDVRLDPTCGAFITMNPGYLGRSELPEGLKALFRPMTVMVPDLVLICENFLMAEGFVDAKILASKFYGLYSLLSDLLSKQLHYDWGLRAVKSVLVVAGSFKRAERSLPEEALLMRALRDFNIPKIVREDEVVFFGLLGDLFPFCDMQPRSNPERKVDKELEAFVTDACVATRNHPDDQFRLKCVQFDELLAIRHCVFLMGPAGAGKTQCWKTLAAARLLRGDKTKVFDLNPKAVKTEELYGYISMSTREWKDGLLSSVMRSVGQIQDGDLPKWIMLDGDLDANWIESMNSVMDDNRMLTLASNERIPLKIHMRMVFEIRDLKHATPATVSRAGILYISTADGTQWQSLISAWLDKREDGDEAKAALREAFDKYVASTLFWIKINVSTIIPLQDMNLVQSLLFMLDSTLTSKVADEPKQIETWFVFCAIWAFGSALTVSDALHARRSSTIGLMLKRPRSTSGQKVPSFTRLSTRRALPWRLLLCRPPKRAQ
jgi:dynein heavy chain